MIRSTFGLTETGAVREENQDHFLMDPDLGLFAVADGLGGLPNGAKASQIALDVLKKTIQKNPNISMAEIITEVNSETREIGYQMDASGFGTTLTLGRLLPGGDQIEIAHVGDSAAYLVENGSVQCLTKEHTVAARMLEEKWQDASEAIPLSAHHTLTQCIGQDLYIDPQVAVFPVRTGTRIFFLTDGVTKPLPEVELTAILESADPIGRIGQSLSFRIEAVGAPDNYTILAVEF